MDSAQRSTFALNLYQIARIIGLPARFIEIRHALSHEELPTLPVLRDACVHVIYHTQFYKQFTIQCPYYDLCLGVAMAVRVLLESGITRKSCRFRDRCREKAATTTNCSAV